MTLKGEKSMANTEYDFELNGGKTTIQKNGKSIPVTKVGLRTLYGLKDKFGNPLITVNKETHTIKISKDVKLATDVQELLSCLTSLADTDRPCRQIIEEDLIARSYEQKGSMEAYNVFSKKFNTLVDFSSVAVMAEKLIRHKGDVILPDFMYFFNKSTYLYDDESKRDFTDELFQSIKVSVEENNLKPVQSKETGKN